MSPAGKYGEESLMRRRVDRIPARQDRGKVDCSIFKKDWQQIPLKECF